MSVLEQHARNHLAPAIVNYEVWPFDNQAVRDKLALWAILRSRIIEQIYLPKERAWPDDQAISATEQIALRNKALFETNDYNSVVYAGLTDAVTYSLGSHNHVVVMLGNSDTGYQSENNVIFFPAGRVWFLIATGNEFEEFNNLNYRLMAQFGFYRIDRQIRIPLPQVRTDRSKLYDATGLAFMNIKMDRRRYTDTLA